MKDVKISTQDKKRWVWMLREFEKLIRMSKELSDTNCFQNRGKIKPIRPEPYTAICTAAEAKKGIHSKEQIPLKCRLSLILRAF